MDHNIDLILRLTGALGFALVMGFVTQKLKLSPIVGYLLAGVIVGPFTPGFVADPDIATQTAEIGVILLMFGVGIHFHLKDLLAVRNVAIPGAIVQIAIATALGALATNMFLGWSWNLGVVFGVAVSVASTVVLTRVLADNKVLHTPIGHIAVGWLIVEDLLTIIVLVLLPAFAGGNPGEASDGTLGLTLGVALLKLAGLIVFAFAIGRKLIPLALGYVARTGSRELFTLTVLVVAMGIAVGSAKVSGTSMALGAFLAGMIVGQSDYSARAASDALPMRDAFSVLFFVSVGMLFDPTAAIREWLLILMTLGIILVGKPLAALLVVLALKKPLRIALSIAVALSQIGEFSFILAALATDLRILPPAGMNALVAGSVVSITLNPLLYRAIDPLVRWLEDRKVVPISQVTPDRVALREDGSADRVVVIGYGPVGKTVSRILRDNGFEVIIVEMNIDTVQKLRTDGTKVVYGDASQREILLHAGIEHAEGLIISSSSVPASAVVQASRELNPRVRILTRATYLAQSAALREAGADAVFSSEGEIALSMADFLMERLGATDEQIDRERDRVRKDLF
jgi:monovalent cation:H+ antiporter-2, CPA2 family